MDEHVRNFQKHVETVQDASEMVDLQLGAPTRTSAGRCNVASDVIGLAPKMDSFAVTHKANTGVRWVHITTRNETPRKSFPTPINTCKR